MAYLQSNKPFQQVSESSLKDEMIHGAVQGGVAAGMMHGGFYGASKVKNPRIKKYTKEGLSHGYGNWKRAAFTYGTAMAADSIVHGVAHKL